MQQIISRKGVVSAVLAFLLAFGVIGVYGAHTSPSVHACVSPSGAVKIVGDVSDCGRNERGIVLASMDDLAAFHLALDDVQSQIDNLESVIAEITTQLASRSIVSPNEQFSVRVSDQGIVLSGPNAEIVVGPTTVEIDGVVVDIASAGPTSIRGSVVTLGCPGGGFPLVRTVDQILVTGTAPAEGEAIALNSIIIGGTTSVLAC